jgi:hypothetical protein
MNHVLRKIANVCTTGADMQYLKLAGWCTLYSSHSQLFVKLLQEQ